MLHFAALTDLNQPAIAADAGEVCGEPVVILLRPAVARVRVAARAADLRAEEHPAHVLGDIARVTGERKEIRGARSERIPVDVKSERTISSMGVLRAMWSRSHS
jgi:hypothetical protein